MLCQPWLLVCHRAGGGAEVDGDQLRDAALLERLAELDAPVLRVGVGPGVTDGLPIAADGIAEHLMPILEILPLQRLAWRLALDRGIDPDRPRGLSKVTQTH